MYWESPPLVLTLAPARASASLPERSEGKGNYFISHKIEKSWTLLKEHRILKIF